MPEVKWIKITTDIFDDEKIILIESLPDAYSIITVWFKLLCLAGKQNNSGVFMLNDKIAYTDKMLATIFRMKESTVSMALQTFEQFGMVELVDGVITIPNWSKHQTLDTFEKKRERDRLYQQKRREHQKLIAEKSSDNRLTIARQTDDKSSCVVVSDIDIEEDIEKEKDNNPPLSPQGERGGVKTNKVEHFPGEPELEEAFKEFLTMRNKIKKPLATKQAITRAKNKLEKLSNGDHVLAVKILQQSTDHCWQDLYELKEEPNGGGKNGCTGGNASEADRDEYAEEWRKMWQERQQ